MLLNGLLVAGLRKRRICVRAQRKPEEKAAEMTRTKPRALNAVSPATIMTTPIVIVAMMRINLTDGVSRRNRNAKRRTKASEEDLHMAKEFMQLATYDSERKMKHTVKSERNEF